MYRSLLQIKNYNGNLTKVNKKNYRSNKQLELKNLYIYSLDKYVKKILSSQTDQNPKLKLHYLVMVDLFNKVIGLQPNILYRILL